MGHGTCRIEECAKPRNNRDTLCSMHRARWYRHGTFDYVGRRQVPIDEVIEKRIVRGDGCWGWTGWVSPDGYAVLRNRGKGATSIHRWMFERHVGALTPGMVIDHACRNRGCVNPSHLRQVSVKQNVENFTTELRSHNTSGYRGVTFHKASGLWMARVKSGGFVRATYHKTKEEAAEAARMHRIAAHTHNDLDRIVR